MISILKKADTGDHIIFEAGGKGDALGSISGEIRDNVLLINELCGLSSLFDGLCRAIFSYAEKRGVCTAEFVCPLPQVLADSGYTESTQLKPFFDNKHCE